MNESTEVNKAIELIAKLSIDKASQVLSKVIKTGARIEMEDAYVADISQVTEKISAESDEVVGAFLDLEGDAPFKFLFFVKFSDSFALADLMLNRPLGTTKKFDIYAASAVQEIGNILGAAISNIFSADFQIEMSPTPPVIVRDFAGVIFEEYIISAAVEKNKIFIIESKFNVVKNDIKCYMFILPVQGSEKTLSRIARTM